jgi:hypothetical protein
MLTARESRWASIGAWATGMGLVAGGVIATGGSAGWHTGGRGGAAVLVMAGFALGGLAIASAVPKSPLAHKTVLVLPALWAAAGLLALLLASPFVRAAEELTIGPVASGGALGLIAAAAVAGGAAGMITGGLLERWFSLGLSRTRISLGGAGWSAALAIMTLLTVTLGVVFGELTKMVASPPLSNRAALVMGWALSGVVAGIIPGLMTRPLLGLGRAARPVRE